jgi:ribose-phosphate pyrophosphokinase
MSHLEPEAKIFACSQSVYLAEKISEHYGIPLGKVTMSKYDGEFQPSTKSLSENTCIYCLFHSFQIQITDGIVTDDRCCKNGLQQDILLQ